MELKNFLFKKSFHIFPVPKSLKESSGQRIAQKTKRWPSFWQWRQVFKVLSKKEKWTFSILCLVAVSCLFFLGNNFYFKNTAIQPDFGGTYIEGMVGQPRFINPIYAQNNDVDRALVELIFSGLMNYDSEGKIKKDLAANYEIKNDGKTYEFQLKKDIIWQDKKPITSDDIVFTVKTIQDPDYKSPLRPDWVGVKVTKISNKKIRFELKNPYPAFIENLTLKILPKHIWENISPSAFCLTPYYNLYHPIGSGPYNLKNVTQDNLGHIQSLSLTANPQYFGKKPFLSKIILQFFEKEQDLIKAAQKGNIQGLCLPSTKNSNLEHILSVQAPDNRNLSATKSTAASVINSRNTQQQNPASVIEFQDYSFSLPRYFAVFFNPNQSKILAQKEIRQVLNYATDKQEIVNKILHSHGKIVNSPILPEYYGFKPPTKIYEFDPKKASQILDKLGFKEKNGERKKIIQKERPILFKKDLMLGDEGPEVRQLQKYLATQPDIYPEGKITGYFGPLTKKAVIKFQEKYKQDILKPWGFKKATGIVSKTTRVKLNELFAQTPTESITLQFSLTVVDQPQLIEVANLLKQQWKKIGVNVEIKPIEPSALEQDIIKPRNYESLLFGELLKTIPDPFSFWHSSQTTDPGLNLAEYKSKQADKLLEQARQASQPTVRAQKLTAFQDILIQDSPAIFLYNPDYIYLISNEIKGIKIGNILLPSKRFSGIENWYIKTKRIWKRVSL